MCRLLLLAAFLVQSNLVQTHAHAAQPVAVSQAGPGNANDTPPAPADTADHCFMCWEAAVAGQYLTPSAPILPPPPDHARWEAARTEHEFALGRTPHGWLSRGPPQ